VQQSVHKQKRAGLAVAAAFAFAAFASTASAAPLNLTDGDKIKLEWGAGTYGHADGGGEFKATGVSVLNGAGDSFLTFCVEFPEHIALNTAYYVDISTQAVGGGNGVAATYTGDVSGALNSYDPLSPATAWLYTQFRNNALQSYVAFSYTSNADANSLQKAIWYLENEKPYSFLDTKGQQLVSAAIGANWNDIGGVRVLNLYDSYNPITHVFSGKHQDQLYITPVPEPETYAMLLAGLGLMGFVARRRRASVRVA